MKTLATPITVANSINAVLKFQLIRAVDHDDATPPWMELVVQTQGGSGKVFPAAGATWTLSIVDSGQSLCLDVNPTPLSYSDQLQTISKTLAGTPYSTLAAANTGTKTASRLAVEALLVPTGALSSAFAGP